MCACLYILHVYIVCVCVYILHVGIYSLENEFSISLYVEHLWYPGFCSRPVLFQRAIAWSRPPSLLVGNYVIYNLQAAPLFVTGN